MSSSTTPELPAHLRRILDLTRHDLQLQRHMPDPAVKEAMRAGGPTYDRMIAIALEAYADRPALGERAYDIVTDASGRSVRQLRPRFETVTYGDLHHRIKSLASVWRHDDSYGVLPGEFVCILGFTGIDMVTIDVACAYAQTVSVPLQAASLGSAALEGVLADAAPACVAATVTDVVLAAELAGNHSSIRSIIVFDVDERVSDERDLVAAARAELRRNGSAARLTSLDELLAAGRMLEWTPPPLGTDPTERLALLLHSSGTTGTPKGAMLLDRHLAAALSAPNNPVPVIRTCFTPLCHQSGRGPVYGALAQGGAAFFVARSDMSTLFDDIRLVRPTESFFFPRVLEMIHRDYQSEVARRAGSDTDDVAAVESSVKAEMRSTFLGDRLCAMAVGGAPTAPEVKQFIVDCFDVAFLEGYGSTEVGMIARNGRVNWESVIDYRLRDVPELGYYSTDQPYPRGELCIKTHATVPGYYKKPEATAALFDEDGFVLTGDIVAQRSRDHLEYIGRRNDTLKLAQGEFVAATVIGEVFEGRSAVIQQMYVYGTATRSFLLAVVVPDLEHARLLLQAEPDESALRTLIRHELKRVAAAAQLKPFEIPRDFIIETEPFSVENGLLTSLRKRIRPKLQHRYGARLEALYDELEQRQSDELLALRNPTSSLSVLQKVGRALEAALGIQELDVSQPTSFAELGGDSLGAIEFAALLADIFGVELPINSILSPAGSPAQWANAIEAALRQDAAFAPTFASVHSRGARELHAADVVLDAFIDDRTLAAAPTVSPRTDSRTVLVTGATGFLGRFLTLGWLERVAPVGGKVICLVRAPDVEIARHRLRAAFADGDGELESHYHALAPNHLEVVVGDIAEPGLGLDPREFDRLAEEVDRIVHPAALVNHILDYEYLFAPNVAGTAELIRLALTQRQKPFDFVSSAAVFSFLDVSRGLDEESPLVERVGLVGRYGEGYGASKWAAELLLHEAHRKFGLPVSVFRGNMMLPHRRYRGQINVEDIFSRLLYSIITTELAPTSFYEPAPDGSRRRAHYEGLPVDFIAGAIVEIGAQPHADLRTFHVNSGASEDGYSLDVFVDWILEAGYPIERVPHEEWFERFQEKLRALPEERRTLTSLGVIDSLRAPYAVGREVGSEKFRSALRGTPLGASTPQLTQDFIDKCLDDLCHLGLISRPAGERRGNRGGGTCATVPS